MINGYPKRNCYIPKKYEYNMKDDSYNSFISNSAPTIERMIGEPIHSLTRSITVQVTDACNLCCKYCYQINKSHNVLSLENAKKFIDLILTDDRSINDYINMYNSSAVVLDFIGGEPLLEIDLISEIADYFVQQLIIKNHPWKDYFRLSIGTNGTLYFDPRVQKFLNKYREKVAVSITVDGNKRLHDSCRVFPDGSGSYDKAIAAVKHWMKFTDTLTPSTKLTIAPGNVEYLSEALISMIEEGFLVIHENCVYEEGWTLEHAKVLYRELKKVAEYIIDHDYEATHSIKILDQSWYCPIPETDNQNWCGGDGHMLAVDVHGDLFNCIRYMESSLGSDAKPLIIGNVDHGIGQTEEEKQNLQCMQCITRRSQSTDECFNCPIGRGCGWCSAYNYQKFGTCNKRATYHCIMHKAASLATAYYWFRVILKHRQDPDPELSTNNSFYTLYCPEDWALPIIGQEEWDMLQSLQKMCCLKEEDDDNKE